MFEFCLISKLDAIPPLHLDNYLSFDHKSRKDANFLISPSPHLSLSPSPSILGHRRPKTMPWSPMVRTPQDTKQLLMVLYVSM